jgi:hypothetical protein
VVDGLFPLHQQMVLCGDAAVEIHSNRELGSSFVSRTFPGKMAALDRTSATAACRWLIAQLRRRFEWPKPIVGTWRTEDENKPCFAR